MANDKRFVVKNGLESQNIFFLSPDRTKDITVSMLDSDTLSFSGGSGQLFSISDSMTGTIFAVNDISGVPSIEVFDTGNIQLAETFGRVLIGTSTDDGSSKLQISGNLTASKFVPTGNVTAGNGMYLPTTNSLGFSTAGTEAIRVDASQNVGINVTPSAKLHVVADVIPTNTVTNVLRLESRSTSTPAVGIGTGIEFVAETATDNFEVGAILEAVTTDVAGGTEDFTFNLKLMAGGAAPNVKLSVPATGGLNLWNSAGTFNHFLSAAATANRILTLPDATGTFALTSNNLGVFAATTSAQLAGVISDETGSGALVFATSPTLTTPNIGAATGTSLTVRPAANQDGITLSGRAGGTSNFAITLQPTTLTANRTLTLPDTTGTLVLTSNNLGVFAATTSAQLAGVISDETGSGALVFATSPSLTTPILGVATATSINRVAITAPATGSTLTIADGKTLTASNTLTFTGTDGSSVAFGAGGTVAYTGSSLAQFAATTSAQLAGVISDETGSGALVFATSPTLTTPNIGVATATSVNRVAITAPATSATLTIANSKTLTVNNTVTLSGTDGSTITFGAGGTVVYTTTSFNLGTTSIALNRASAAQTLSGISIDGNAGTVTNGVYTTGDQTIGGNKTFTGNIISTHAWDATTGGGEIYLNGATGNRIDFNTNGVAAPAFTTRSVGTKIVLYPNVSATEVDFALGVESNTMWFSTYNSSAGLFKWYGGTTTAATLTGSGNLSLTGSLTAVSKSFLIDHPTKSGMKLQYASLEGPENGVYVRGRLVDSTVIELPDYWTGLVDESTISVNLTPVGSKQDLWIEDIQNNRVIVGSDKPINCFYTVFAERKDIERLTVEFRSK